jgi:aquaporin Z
MSNTVKFVMEFMGTFVFLSVILGVGEPIPIALALLVAIYFGGAVSGGHFNPAVSFMMWMNNKVDTNTAVAYAGSQLAGAAAAWWFFTHVVKPNRSA